MFDVKKDLLSKILKRFSDNHLLVSENRIWTFREFIEESYQFSKFLNFKHHNRVPISSENSEFLLKILLALWFKRAIAIPLNPSIPLSKKKELLIKVGCIEDPSEELLEIFYNHSSKNNLKKNYPRVNNKIFKTKINQNKLSINTKSWGTIIFTSGSSGFEKPVVHSVGNHFYNALGANIKEPLKPGDRWLLSLPLYHVGGLAIFFRILLSGAAMVVPNEKKNISKIIKNFKISHISLVPTQLYRLLQTKDGQESLKNLKLILLGGANIPEPLIKKTKDLGLKIKTTYGSTEMASQIATGSIDSYKILPFREVRISQKNEIEVRGKTRFLGYYNEEKLIKPFNKNGWFKTGDLGFWNSIKQKKEKSNVYTNNSLKVFGRIDGMFISGGENILPEEIENIIFKSKMVDQAIVVSVEDKEFGKRPVAFIKFLGSFTDKKLRKYLKKYLLSFKIPDLFIPWEDSFENVFKNSRKELTKIAQPKFDLWRKKKLLR